jgi:hypothetical protein
VIQAGAIVFWEGAIEEAEGYSQEGTFRGGDIMSASRRIADRFEIRDPQSDLLGRGSIGEVCRATDVHTGEPVAVKALDPRVVARDPDIVERFVREGEALR